LEIAESPYLTSIPVAKRVYFLINVCFYGVRVLVEETVATPMKELMLKYMEECTDSFEEDLFQAVSEESSASGNPEHNLLSFVSDLIEGFLNESFGLPLYADCLRFFLRVKFPAKVRAHIWKEVTQVDMMGLLNGEHEVPGSFMKYLYPVDSNPALLNCYVEALKSERFCQQGGFTRSIAIHHLANDLFDGEEHFSDAPKPSPEVTSSLLSWGKKNRMEEILTALGSVDTHPTLVDILSYPRLSKTDETELLSFFHSRDQEGWKNMPSAVEFSDARKNILRLYCEENTLLSDILMKLKIG